MTWHRPGIDDMDQTPEHLPSTDRQPSTSAFQFRKVFFNQVELRAGWRLLIFTAILLLTPARTFFFSGVQLPSSHSAPSYARNARPAKRPAVEFRPGPFITNYGFSLILLLGLSAFMAMLEDREMGHYGLPLKQAFRGNFWLGCLWGFAAISLLLLVLRANRHFYYGPLELSGWSIVRFASLWSIAFLLVGLFEEYLLRGYAQFTLTLGFRFWPAAVLLSLFFAFLHRDNPGETVFGLFQIVLIALFFCFTLWRSGTLWFAVGFHAAWDWSQSFFYGTPDSGIPAKGHLLHSSIAGPDWLTGGTVGPEGSVLVAPLLVLLFVLFYFAFPKRAQYPDPDAIKSGQSALVPQTTLGI
jgi:membrane protease YdiL (CAAX protease family)